jgi:hypothetical protein
VARSLAHGLILRPKWVITRLNKTGSNDPVFYGRNKILGFNI